MSEQILESKIKKVIIKTEPWGNKGYYGHKVTFQDGTRGEISQCREANPSWLKEGEVLKYYRKEGKFPDCPFIIRAGERSSNGQEESVEEVLERNFPKQRNNTYSKSSYGNRYEDSPDIWLKKQKFISALKLYEVLAPLILSGSIKYEGLQDEVSKHLTFILTKSGMNESILPTEPAPLGVAKTQNIPVSVRQVSPSPDKCAHENKLSDDRETHTLIPRQEEPNLNPEDYTTQPMPELFSKDDISTQEKEEMIKAVVDKIYKCKSKAKLLSVQKTLTEEQLVNPEILDAFFKQRKEISNK